MHSEEKPFKCKLCDKRFFWNEKCTHYEEKKFKCKFGMIIEPRGVTVTWPISKKMKILDFLKFGQRCLGWFWLIERLSLLAQIDVWMALGLSNVDQS